MVTLYPTIYRDKYGEEQIIIESTGTNLRTVIRGVEFTGTDFEILEPTHDSNSRVIQPFIFSYGSLTQCRFECQIPITIAINGNLVQGVLLAEIILEPRAGGLILQLLYEKMTFKSSNKNFGNFEAEMFDIQKQLPEGTYLKACVFCTFTDYHPLGNGNFGDIACFRDNKDGIRQANDKNARFRVWETKTEMVQETHLCPEFEKRQK